MIITFLNKTAQKQWLNFLTGAIFIVLAIFAGTIENC